MTGAKPVARVWSGRLAAIIRRESFTMDAETHVPAAGLSAEPRLRSLRNWTILIYALHAFSIARWDGFAGSRLRTNSGYSIA